MTTAATTRRTTNRRRPRSRAAFSMVELLAVIAILALLIGILSVALGGARKSAQRASDSQLLSNIKVSIGLFENDHGFIPPLVKDNSQRKYPGGWSDGVFGGSSTPVNRTTNDVNVFRFGGRTAEAAADAAYLRGDGIDLFASTKGSGDYRFSEYSLAYYLVGALPASVDNVEGPGLANPKSNGKFDGDTKRVGSYLDVGDPPELVGLQDGTPLDEYRYELRDAAGNAVRFYRWLPDENVATGGFHNVPQLIARPDAETDLDPSGNEIENVRDPRARSARWAAVTAGPDGFFGDTGSEDVTEMAIEAGLPYEPGSAPTLEQAAALSDALSEDNNVILGDG